MTDTIHNDGLDWVQRHEAVCAERDAATTREAAHLALIKELAEAAEAVENVEADTEAFERWLETNDGDDPVGVALVAAEKRLHMAINRARDATAGVVVIELGECHVSNAAAYIFMPNGLSLFEGNEDASEIASKALGDTHGPCTVSVVVRTGVSK